MKTNQSLAALAIFGLMVLYFLMIPSDAEAAGSQGGVQVSIAGYYWYDPGSWLNTTNGTTVPILGCGADAVAQGGVPNCYPDPPTPANCTITPSGSLVADIVDSEPGYQYMHVRVIDESKPGTVTASANVSGEAGVSCDPVSWAVSAIGKYDPNNSCKVCSSAKGSPSAGSGNVDNNSVEFRLNLGQSAIESSAGFLWLDADGPSTSLAQPSSLQLPISSVDVQVITNTGGVISQVRAPQMLVNIYVVNAYQYQLQCFYATNITAFTNGLYGTNAAAFDTWVVQNPDTNSAYNRLWITEQPAGAVRDRKSVV